MDRLKKIFATVLNIPIEQVNTNLSPENTPSWDSLNAIILVTEIEQEFQIRFGYDEVMAVKNFSDVFLLLSSKGIVL